MTQFTRQKALLDGAQTSLLAHRSQPFPQLNLPSARVVASECLRWRSILQGFRKTGSNFLDLGTPLPEGAGRAQGQTANSAAELNKLPVDSVTEVPLRLAACLVFAGVKLTARLPEDLRSIINLWPQ
jgi:hypothetical protein